jgi:hypothetical protein
LKKFLLYKMKIKKKIICNAYKLGTKSSWITHKAIIYWQNFFLNLQTKRCICFTIN